jgi:hypothetical protein
MLDTYIKNRGITKTIIHNNNRNQIKEMKWDADYDGNVAKISLDLDSNGTHNNYHFSLDNNDLANILNVNSVRMPLERRLKRDFKKTFRNKPRVYQIEFDNSETPESSESPFIPNEETYKMPKPVSIEEILKPVTHLSSPKQNEEFIIPMTIDENKEDNYTLTPRRHHRRPKTHKTYNKIYKINRRKSSSKSRRKNRTKSTRNGFLSLL